jgi:hypothetical protein
VYLLTSKHTGREEETKKIQFKENQLLRKEGCEHEGERKMPKRETQIKVVVTG